MKSKIADEILKKVFITKSIGKKQICESISTVTEMRKQLLPFVKKGILKEKLTKKELNHKDVLVILRHLAKEQNRYILYKRKSLKVDNKWKTGYVYRLTE